MKPRKICVVTGSRAEYGLLEPLMREIKSDAELELQVVVTGAHLFALHGMTVQKIESDGFKVSARVDCALGDDSSVGIVKSMAHALTGFADELSKLQPDLLVVLGDRYEILSAAEAALILRIPIAHIHGGEITEGAYDDAIRHALTKMSHLHFVAAEAYRNRVLQLGEDPNKVFNFGAPGLDHIFQLKMRSQSELEKDTGITFKKTNFLITYHPVTLQNLDSVPAVDSLLAALDLFPEAGLIFTGTNADTGAQAMQRRITEYVAKNSDRAVFRPSLGQLNYLSAVSLVDAIIGNSSSGIIEVPALKKPTVNIGDRQKGRLRAASVIDCAEDAEAIRQAITRAMSPQFRTHLSKAQSPYGGDGTTSKKIKQILKTTDLSGIIQKKFYDLPQGAKKT